MVCKCGHGVDYHSEFGCRAVDCLCEIAASTTFTPKASYAVNTYYCVLCKSTIDAATDLEGIVHIGCPGGDCGSFTRKPVWSRGISIKPDKTIMIYRFYKHGFNDRYYKPTAASQQRIAELFSKYDYGFCVSVENGEFEVEIVGYKS